jgi:hypothetical protein
MFESHHVSRHFEHRCQESLRKAKTPAAKLAANRRRSRTIKALPKLSLAVRASSHLILAARATTGAGPDYEHFVPLVTKARARVPLETALADAGFDSESNHCHARERLGIGTLIPATSGRPGMKPPQGEYRRIMREEFSDARRKKPYGQRWQCETVNSMIKRNLGSACRAKTAAGRKKDLRLRVLTHNLMIIANK